MREEQIGRKDREEEEWGNGKEEGRRRKAIGKEERGKWIG